MDKSVEERLQVLEDREAIATLQARYVNLNDGGWAALPTHRDPHAVAEMFTDDGVWIGPLGLMRADGPDAIAALFVQFQAIPFIVHNIMNPLIEIDGDLARGQWHAVIATTLPGGQAFWTLGRYNNDYRRTAQGWKCSSMVFEAAAITSYEKGWGAEQFLGAQSSVVATDG